MLAGFIGNCRNVPDRRGDTSTKTDLNWNTTETVKILLRCPRVDLRCRDEEIWSLVFRAIQNKNLGEEMLGDGGLK